MQHLTILWFLLLPWSVAAGKFSSAALESSLREQDEERIAYLTDKAGAKKVSRKFKMARDRFYKASCMPLETTCKVLKLMGKKRLGFVH